MARRKHRTTGRSTRSNVVELALAAVAVGAIWLAMITGVTAEIGRWLAQTIFGS